MTDEARRQAAEILSAATDQYHRHFDTAEVLIRTADDKCEHSVDECECNTPDEIRADAATHAQLASAAAVMAQAMTAFLATANT